MAPKFFDNKKIRKFPLIAKDFIWGCCNSGYLPKICWDALKVMAKQATKRSAKARLTRK